MQANLDVSYTDVTEVYLQELRRGNRVSPGALAKQFPQFADRILAEFPAMANLEGGLAGKRRSFPSIPNYQLLSEIGSGAYGVVYKAKHSSGAIVAIKLVRVERDYPRLARLEREIESLSRLSHSNIVSIESYGITDDFVFIVTNLVEGISLNELVISSQSPQAVYWRAELRSEWNLLANWGYEISSALEYIHQNRIIHRDIKPSNILIDTSGKSWIIDFGLAKLSETGMSVTHSRQVAGTPRFMAPEQLRGVVDVRCDIYSLGRTLYELARNQNDCDELSAELSPIGKLNPDLPSELARIIDKACETLPEKRFQSSKELTAVLARYREGKTPSDRRRRGKRISEQEFKTSMRRRMRWAITGSALSFFVAVAALTVPHIYAKYKEPIASNTSKPNDSLKMLASAIENDDSGFVEVIGEALKHSVVSKSQDKSSAAAVASRIDRIVEKVATEGLKPGELDSLITKYRNSPVLNANKVSALHHPLQRTGLSEDQKRRGHAILEQFSEAIADNRIDKEKADDRVLASLFQGDVPKLEQLVSLQIPDESMASWLKLVESSFASELQSHDQKSGSNQEFKSIIDGLLQDETQG